MKFNNIGVKVISILSVFMLAGCSNNLDDDKFKVGMVSDVGGVNDMSFNQSAWSGMKEFGNRTGATVRYLESSQVTEYASNLDRFADQNYDLIFGVGNAMFSSVEAAARTNPELKYVIIDNDCSKTELSNLTGVVFRAQEAAFLVGYIAALNTKTNKVGFIGGIPMDIIDQFHYGYLSGIEYAKKESKKKVEVIIQYAQTFTDSAIGKAIASKLFKDGCDIIFHAAGGAAAGIVESAKETGNFIIGVDSDQSYLSPKHVLTSALKTVGKAVDIVSTRSINGENLGGKTLSFGLEDDCVGIPLEHDNYSEEIYNKAMIVREKIINGDIVPGYNKETYSKYLKTLDR